MLKTQKIHFMEENNSIEMRDAFAEALLELGEQYKNMVFLDADLHTSTKASMFKERYPDRFYQFGIAEQNMFGAAAGLAIEGFIPFPSTFAVFASRRALDQIAISICYANLNVKIPGSYVGVPTSRAGASHNSVEDIAIMRSMPNMKVADPASNNDLKAIMRTAIKTDGPVYFRVARYSVKELFDERHTFTWGKANLLREGEDVTLFGTGIMSAFCLEAADILKEKGYSAEVIHIGSIKPIDRESIITSVSKTACAVTAENASVIGGFGDAVLEVLAEEHPAPVKKIGVKDRFLESGGMNELFTLHQMQPKDIAEAALSSMQLKNKSL